MRTYIQITGVIFAIVAGSNSRSRGAVRLGVSPRRSRRAVILAATGCGLTPQSRGTRARAARAPHCERYSAWDSR